jgi:hypothetical protein
LIARTGKKETTAQPGEAVKQRRIRHAAQTLGCFTPAHGKGGEPHNPLKR